MPAAQAPLLDPETKGAIAALNVEDELSKLRETLRRSGQPCCFRAEHGTVGNLVSLLTRGCRVLHFTGHGLENGDLAFENDQVGATRMCSPRAPCPPPATRAALLAQ